MQPEATYGPDRMLAQVSTAPPSKLRPVPQRAHDSAYLLQRTQALVNDAPADPSYWTAYDYFKLEREARAIRRAYLGGLIARAWRRLREGFAAPAV